MFDRQYQGLIDEFSSPKEGSQPLHFDTQYAQNAIGQYKLLTWRYMATYWRTTEYNAVRWAALDAVALTITLRHTRHMSKPVNSLCA